MHILNTYERPINGALFVCRSQQWLKARLREADISLVVYRLLCDNQQNTQKPIVLKQNTQKPIVLKQNTQNKLLALEQLDFVSDFFYQMNKWRKQKWVFFFSSCVFKIRILPPPNANFCYGSGIYVPVGKLNTGI